MQYIVLRFKVYDKDSVYKEYTIRWEYHNRMQIHIYVLSFLCWLLAAKYVKLCGKSARTLPDNKAQHLSCILDL